MHEKSGEVGSLSNTRRFFLMAILCLGLPGVTTEALAQTGTATGPKPSTSQPEAQVFNWEGREVVSPVLLTAEGVRGSAIGNVLSILFRDAKVSLQGDTNRLAGVWLATIRIPVAQAKGGKGLRIKQDIRAFVSKDAGTKVTILFDAGGKANLLEFPFGMKFQGEVSRTFQIQTADLTNYTMTLLIAVERRTAKDIAEASVDSIDVDTGGSKSGSAGKGKRKR